MSVRYGAIELSAVIVLVVVAEVATVVAVVGIFALL